MFAAFGQKRGHPFPLLRGSVILASIKGSMQKELAVKAGLKGETVRGQDRKKKARFPQICRGKLLAKIPESRGKALFAYKKKKLMSFFSGTEAAQEGRAFQG